MGYFQCLTILVCGLIALSTGQVAIGDQIPCGTDNLSCVRGDPRTDPLECYNRTSLCDGFAECTVLGGDEGGLIISALNCDTRSFLCQPTSVPLELLCDGIDDCQGGDDETTPLCENKCRNPYYGGCDPTQECINSELDVNCGPCLRGFALSFLGPPFGLPLCVLARFAFTSSNYNEIESGLFLEAELVLITEGLLDQEISITVTPTPVFVANAAIGGAEFSLAPIVVTFPAGSIGGTTIPFDVQILNDLEIENAEIFELIATSDLAVFEPGNDVATATILDDDVLELQYELPSYDIVEGDSQEVCLVVVPGSLGILTAPVDITVSTVMLPDGATNGVDYQTVVQQPLTWFPTSTRECWTVTTLEDFIDEGQESFGITAQSTFPGLQIPDPGNFANVNIIDDDVLDFRFTMNPYTVNEGDGSVDVCIELFQGVTQQNVPIEVTFSDNTATGADYNPLQDPIFFVFPPGAAPPDFQCTTVAITDDLMVEGQESFTASASSSNAEVAFPEGNTTAVIIIDNDVARYEFTAPIFIGSEQAQSVNVSLRLLDASLTAPGFVTVFDVPGGNAIVNADFPDPFVIVEFPAGSMIGAVETFSIPITDDLNPEGDIPETFTIQASPQAPGTINPEDATAVVQIIDNDMCEIGFEMTEYTVMEGNVVQMVCLTKLNNAILTEAIDVTITTSLATTIPAGKAAATPNVDFDVFSQMLSFGPGLGPVCANIMINEDSADEPNEIFDVTATSTNSQLVVSTPQATVCITDDDVVVFQIDQTSVSVNEADGTAMVCLNLISGSANRQLSFSLSTVDNTAQSPGDYSAGPFGVAFPPNAPVNSQQCFFIPIQDDFDVEMLEQFLGTVSSADGGVVIQGQMTATVSIVDNDIPRFQFTQPIYSFDEDVGDATIGVQLFDRTLSFPIAVTITDILGGTALRGLDYTAISEILTFPTGSAPGVIQTLTFPIVDDSLDEILENLILEGTVGAPAVFPDTAIVQIRDNDNLEVVIEQPSYTVFERVDDVVMVCLITNNAVQLTMDVDVLLSTRPLPATGDKDAATASDDYVPASNVVVTFSPGTTRACASITIIDDSLDERTERFQVFAMTSNSDSITIPAGGETAEVCIEDDDFIVFGFQQPSYDVPENSLTEQACVELLEGTLTRDVPVIVTTSMGLATEVMDYSPVTVSLLFPSGSTVGTVRCFNLPVVNDQITEETENFGLLASSTDSEADFAPGRNTANVNIIDDDLVPIRLVPPPGLSVPEYTVPEDGGSQEICVEINNPSNLDILEKDVNVVLTTSDGVAVAGQDYLPITNQLLQFTPGNQNAQLCVNISIIDDTVCEGDESFTITLSSSDDCVNILQPAVGTVTIVDNDEAVIGPQGGVLHYNVTERLDMEVWVPIVLTGSKGAGRSCRVMATTMDGTASAGMDYVDTTETLTFDSSTSEQLFHVEILNDDICEGHESFSVYLSTSDDGCTIAPGQNEVIIWIWDDEVHFGDDPHFSIALPGGKLLCYTVQGEHGFSFNLINNERIVMNSKFVPDARRAEVTWLGSMGIIVTDSRYKGSNTTKLRFEVDSKTIHIGEKVELHAKNIDKLTFSDGKMTISEAAPTTGFRYPSVLVDLKDVEISFTIKFTNQHLDMYWHSTGNKITNSHGLIGQFFREGVEIDETRKFLLMPDKEPVPVMRRPVWAFMEREEKDDQLCWTAMNRGYQGEGLIDGSYTDYLVNDVMSTDFKFGK